MEETPADRVAAFYSGGADDRGRRLETIWKWPDSELERVHDFIQWVFPTGQPSGVNPSAPLVTRETRERFREELVLQDNLRRSLDRLLAFYGLRRRAWEPAARVEIDPERFERRAAGWLEPGNHNHLRLTRIMQSLACLGLAAEARALQRCLLEDIAPGPGRGRITSDTLRFWSSAVEAAGYTPRMRSDDGVVAEAFVLVELAEVDGLLTGGEDLPFTAGEMAYAKAKSDPGRRLAARLAAKRAASGLLGPGFGPSDVEVVRGHGAPSLRFSPAAEARLHALGATRTLVSLTHERQQAAASVLLLCDG